MLTKDLLRFRSRSGNIIPEFLDNSDDQIVVGVKSLVEGAASVVCASVGDARTQLLEIAAGIGKCGPGIVKTLEDQFEFDELDPEIAVKRWEMIKTAQFCRERHNDREEFRRATSSAVGRPWDDLQRSIYSDLPDARRIKSIPAMSAANVIDRYNVALVKGLLVRAEEVNIKVVNPTIQEKRRLFRALRFHRLTPAIESTIAGKPVFEMQLGGPLSMFGAGGLYGLAIANFFPHVLHCQQWTLMATIPTTSAPSGKRTLRLDQTCGLASTVASTGGHIPPEFKAFAEALQAKLKAFNTAQVQWSVNEETDPIPLGGGRWMVPDFEIAAVTRGKAQKRIVIELFHKWHATAFVERLRELPTLKSDKTKVQFLLGVSKSIADVDEVAKLLRENEKVGVFVFKDFPTPSAVLSTLKKLGLL